MLIHYFVSSKFLFIFFTKVRYEKDREYSHSDHKGTLKSSTIYNAEVLFKLKFTRALFSVVVIIIVFLLNITKNMSLLNRIL